MVCALDSRSSGPGSSPGWGHCVVVLGETLACEQAHLRVTHVSDKEQSSLVGRSLVKRCQESEPALISVIFSFLLARAK